VPSIDVMPENSASMDTVRYFGVLPQRFTKYGDMFGCIEVMPDNYTDMGA
jgi:hypothetical protein